MRWLRSILAELWGLFVDDGRYALTIVTWLLLSWLVLPLMHVGGGWDEIILFAGLLLILLESALRSAGR
ncbi:MAG: hypothetical protein ABI268_11830 [Rhodanobacter sp.]